MAHTKGPWVTVFNAPDQLSCASTCSIYGESDDTETGYVADVYRNHVGSFITEEEYTANARLIAAAPELLEALYSIIRHGELANIEIDPMGRMMGKKPSTKDVWCIPRHMLPDIKAAISKATGE